MNKLPIVVITAAPIEAQPGFFEPRLAGRVLHSATRTPFFDAARALRRSRDGAPASLIGAAVDELRAVTAGHDAGIPAPAGSHRNFCDLPGCPAAGPASLAEDGRP